jgi:hypothetical protein
MVANNRSILTPLYRLTPLQRTQVTHADIVETIVGEEGSTSGTRMPFITMPTPTTRHALPNRIGIFSAIAGLVIHGGTVLRGI